MKVNVPCWIQHPKCDEPIECKPKGRNQGLINPMLAEHW